MMWLLAIAFGLLLGLAGGGNLSNLARLKFRLPWLLVGAVVVREAVTFTPLSRVDAARYVYMLSLALIVLWTVWHLKLLPGIWLVTAGALSNLIVLAANGGRMPVALDLARTELGGVLVQRGQIGQYTLMGPDTHLNGLADWLSIWPLAQAYSPGDLLIAIGLALVILVAVHRLPEPDAIT
jgi:uncharacterized protein DUF5317